MNFSGKIIQILPARSGVSEKSGKEWKSQEFVVENNEGQFPCSLVFNAFNREIGADVGDIVYVQFDGRAREYNGRWFNSLDAYSITKPQPQAMYQPQGYQPPVPNIPEPTPPQDDQLPF